MVLFSNLDWLDRRSFSAKVLDKTMTLVIKKVVLRAEPLLLETLTPVQLNLNKLISNNLSFELFK